MSPNRPRFRQIRAVHFLNSSAFLLLITIVSITIVHYITSREEVFVHVVFRELYYIPVILAGFRFGLKGGQLTALIVSALYFPIAIGEPGKFSGHAFGNVLQILLFNIVGFLVGWLREQELRHQEEKSQEDALIKTGKAVACIAHDMKTPLLAIGGFARQLLRSMQDNDGIQQKLEIIVQQSQRLEVMVQDMLKFTKPLELECRLNDLNLLVEETILLVREKARLQNVHIYSRIEGKLPPYLFDYYRLQQALLNLVNNAIEASPVDGKIFIRCSCRPGGKGVLLEIEDSGEGLMKIKENDIFEPFVTSKKEGTGLGLPIVKKIIEAHQGTLDYEQKADRGMIFRIMLTERVSSLHPD